MKNTPVERRYDLNLHMEQSPDGGFHASVHCATDNNFAELVACSSKSPQETRRQILEFLCAVGFTGLVHERVVHVVNDGDYQEG